MKFKLLCLKNSLMLFFLLFTTLVAFSKTLEHPIPKTVTVNLHRTKAFSIITSAQTGDWSATSTWFGGVVPTSTDDVVIASGHEVTVQSALIRDPSTNTTVATGATLAAGASYTNNGITTINGTFKINTSGYAGGNGFVYTGTTSTLIFNNGGLYDINSGQAFWPTSNAPFNVTVNTGSGAQANVAVGAVEGILSLFGPLDLKNIVTVNGTLEMNANAYVSTNSPIYGSNSTLKYNSGGIYGRGFEWIATSGPGYPNNVQVSGNTTLDYPNTGSGAFSNNFGVVKNLTIDAGSALFMDYGGGANKSGKVTVGGNVTINGDFSLGNAIGGDLNIAGNWSRTGAATFSKDGTFSPNNRAVFFTGITAQSITGATTFDYLTINNSAGVTLANNITVNSTLDFTNGKLKIGANDLTIGSGGTITNAIAGKYVETNSTGQLKRTVGSSDILFPVGKAAYNPFILNNAGTPDVYGIRVEDGPLTTGLTNVKTVNRKWLVSEAVAGGNNLKVVGQYNTGEINTGFAGGTTPKIGLYNGSCWTDVTATAAGSSPFTFTSSSNITPVLLPGAQLNGTQYFAVGKDNAFSAPLSISKQPVTPIGYVCEDGPLTLTVEATGSTNLSYEWKKDGVAIPGAPNSATYYIAHTTLATAGTYSVIVYDNCSRTITSNDAVITIDPIPTMAKPVSTTICGAGGKSFITFSGLIPGITGQFLYSTSVTPSNVLSEIGTADVNGEYEFETTFIPPSYNRATVTIIQGINTVSGCSKFFTIPDNQFIIDIGKVAVWNGSTWTNSGPSIYNAAYFGAAYSKSVDITTCAVIVDGSAVVTIPTGKTLTVTEGITVTSGSLTIKSDANLIQLKKDAVNTGNINVERTVTGLRYQPGSHVDYVYWSSPVASQKTKNTVGFFDGFSPYTPNDRFYTYRESNDRFYETGDPIFVPGKGYAVQAETNKGTSYNKDYKFTGKPNNGDISYNITKVGGGYNLVGNPYPSNINFEELYQNNSTIIENTAWFWTNNVFVASQQGSGYGGNNYAVWNGSGGVSATSTPSGSPTPTGIIKVGQGFIVQKKNTGTSALQFKNSYSAGHDLRVSSTAPFFQKGVSEKNRFTLQLLSPSQLINSQLIAYVPGATNDYEQDYDAEAFDNSSDLFYSILPGKKLVIQGKSAAFTIEDKVLLGANFFQAGSYIISLDNMEGIFNGTQNVYLKDKQEGIITNLSQAAYTFNATKGDNSGRFEIIYKPESVLATNVTTKEELMVYEDSGDFVIKAQSKKITDLQVFDMNGRLVMNLKPNSTKAVIPANTLIKGVYVLKISQDGIVTSKKIVK